MSTLKAPQAKAAKTMQLARLLLAGIIAVIIPIWFFLKYSLADAPNMTAYVIAGVVTILFAIYFGFFFFTDSRISSGRRHLKRQFNLKEDNRNASFQFLTNLGIDYTGKHFESFSGDLDGIPVVIGYEYKLSKSDDSESFGKTISNTLVFIGKDIDSEPPQNMESHGFELQRGTWLWKAEKDVSDDYINLEALIRAAASQIK